MCECTRVRVCVATEGSTNCAEGQFVTMRGEVYVRRKRS